MNLLIDSIGFGTTWVVQMPTQISDSALSTHLLFFLLGFDIISTRAPEMTENGMIGSVQLPQWTDDM